jgi:hypothetical protein
MQPKTTKERKSGMTNHDDHTTATLSILDNAATGMLDRYDAARGLRRLGHTAREIADMLDEAVVTATTSISKRRYSVRAATTKPKPTADDDVTP